MGRKRKANQPWASPAAIRNHLLQALGPRRYENFRAVFDNADREIAAQKKEAIAWENAFLRLRKVRAALISFRDAAWKSRAFAPASRALTGRKAMEVALPILSAIQQRREADQRRHKPALPVGVTPMWLNKYLRRNLASARWSVRRIERLLKAIRPISESWDPVLKGQRTTIIARKLALLEEETGRRLVGTEAALLDLDARETKLDGYEQWTKLRQQWHAALTRARKKAEKIPSDTAVQRF